MFDEDEEPIGGQTLAAPDKETIILDGYLKKKSPKGFIKAWQERYICLTREGLFYFKRKESPHHQGAIPILAISLVESDPSTYKKKGFRMDIRLDEAVSNRVFSFTAKTEAEIEKWVQEIRLVLIDARSRQREEQNDPSEPPTTAIAAAGAGEKIWKNIQPTRQQQPVVRREDRRGNDLLIFLNTFKPVYPVLSPPPRTLIDNPNKLASAFFGNYKIESQEQCGPLGEIYLLANPNYVINHQSYLIHTIPFSSEYHDVAVQSMELIMRLNFPLFPQQVGFGTTSDSTYCIYRPPLRNSHDSLFSWLDRVTRFPEDVIAHLLLQILITFEYLHSNDLQLYLLSPETTYFDADGVFRIADFYIGAPPETIGHLVPEYTPPEVVEKGPAASTIASDYWKLGVFLYEISTGVPPFRTDNENIDPLSDIDPVEQYHNAIYHQLSTFTPSKLDFPPFVSQPLRTLITDLLQPDPTKRIQSIDKLKKDYTFISSLSSLDDRMKLDYYFNNTHPQWIYDNVVQSLAKDKSTPINLTFAPEQVSLHRLVVKLSCCRQLFTDPNARLAFLVHAENDSYRSQLITQQLTSYNDILQQSDPSLPGLQQEVTFSNVVRLGLEYIFDFFTPGFTLTSELVIEIYSRRSETDKGTLVGSISFPLRDLKAAEVIDSWCTVYDTHGQAVGEVKLRTEWETEFLDLGPNLFFGLTDGSKTFAESFAKPVPKNQGRLWSCVVDPSSVLSEDQDLNPNLQSPGFSTIKGGSQASHLQTMNLSGSSKAMQLLSGTPPQQPSQARNLFDPLPASNSGSKLSSHKPSTPKALGGQFGGGGATPSAASGGSGSPAIMAAGESPQGSPALMAVATPAQPLTPEDDPTKWKTATDAKGALYYYNSVTKTTSWTPPPCGVITASGVVIAAPTTS